MIRAFLLLLLLAGQAHAQAFQPRNVQPTTVRVWGDPYMASVLLAWEDRFHVFHPEIHFTNRLLGTDTAMGALYGNIADLALFGRETTQTEDDGFLHSLQYRPLRLRLLNGSLDVPNKTPAPVFFVHATNPLARLTLPDARRALGYVPSAPAARTWGDLGLTGAWKNKPLHVYTYDLDTGTGLFVLQALQGPGKKMNWQVLQEFRDIRRDDGSTYEAAEQTLDALAKDPDGLAVSTLRFATPQVKPLPLAADDHGPYVAATPLTLIDGTYPLARRTYAFVNQPPSRPVPPAVAEFLRFVLSPEGQALVAAQPGFLPLSPTDAATQAHLLQ